MSGRTLLPIKQDILLKLTKVLVGTIVTEFISVSQKYERVREQSFNVLVQEQHRQSDV